MKLVVTSDWHLDWNTAGMRRFSDLARGVKETVDYAVGQAANGYVFLGDLMNPDSGSRVFECAALAIHTALELARHGIESHWLSGNHDVIEDGHGNTTLTPLAALSNRLVNVYEVPQLKVLKDQDVSMARFLALPYTSLAHAYDPAEQVAKLGSSRLPLIIAGHMTEMAGIIPGSESKEMPRGRGMPFPFEAIAERDERRLLMLNGHFHEQQVFRGVHIPGALERLTFGEQHHSPGWLVVEV